MSADRKIEVELKYQVSSLGGADRYLVAPELGPFKPAGVVDSIRVEDRYVDSADWALARAGFAARLRKTSRGTEIELKSLAVGGARIQHRQEIEGPANLVSAPVDWPASRARDVVLEHCGDAAVTELLTIRQLRRTRRLKAGGTRAELSVDEVEVVVDGRVLDSFEEMEIELKGGGEAPLESLVDVLDRDPALHRVSRSKLDRAVEAIRMSMLDLPDEVRLRWESAPADLLDRMARPATPAAPAATTDSAPAAPPTAPAAAPRSRGKTRSRKAARTEVAAPAVKPEQVAAATAPAGATAPAVAGSEAPAPATPPAAAPKPGPRALGVGPDDSLPEAARKVLRFHFGRLQHREAGTRSGVDPEELHNMRVAARRMRAAWRVFDDAFKPGKTKKLRRRIETLSDRLGAVRDLDVLIEGLQAYSDGMNPSQQRGLDPLLSLWKKQRDGARSLLITELDSSGHKAFVEEMDEFLAAGANAAANVGAPTTPHRVRDRAPSQLWAAYEAVRAYELVLPWADVETLHQLRIASKWLRYTLEFFGEALGPDTALLIERTVALQDYLGNLNDADIASKLARDVLVARADRLSRTEAEAIGAYLRLREREVARLRRSLGPVWRAVNGATFRRALGRATAAL